VPYPPFGTCPLCSRSSANEPPLPSPLLAVVQSSQTSLASAVLDKCLTDGLSVSMRDDRERLRGAVRRAEAGEARRYSLQDSSAISMCSARACSCASISCGSFSHTLIHIFPVVQKQRRRRRRHPCRCISCLSRRSRTHINMESQTQDVIRYLAAPASWALGGLTRMTC
jgi:hypothetical protein